MADIHPFQAILYRSEAGGDVTPYMAPPYDVIDPAGQVVLRERDPNNIIRLTLPEATPGGDPYQVAAGLFQDWQAVGMLYQAEKPAMYVWEQEFRYDGATYRRRALVVKVSCEPYRPGGVMRHEHTHAGPKADRLNLFKATGAQFSQIFGIFDDDGGKASELLSEVAAREVLQSAQGDDGHTSRLYGTSEAGIIGQVLYLEAEAHGLRGTGIGCYFDDAVHDLLGLKDDSFQSMYHFTVGMPIEDDRLTTLPPYFHLKDRRAHSVFLLKTNRFLVK